MDLAMKVSCAVLLTIGIAKCEGHTEIIKKIAFELAAHFRSNCFLLLHRFDDDSHAKFEAFKSISTDVTRFIAANTFQQKTDEFPCPKPMNILIGGEYREEFAKYTNKDSMTDEVWVVFLTTSVSEFLNNSKPKFDSELIVAEMENPREVLLWEVYSVDDEFPLRITLFGNWTEMGGLTHPKLPLYDRRSDLEGKVIKVGSNENWPISTFENGVWSGFMPNIWMELDRMMNCTTQPVRSVDNATGLQLENGSWNGLMGMMLTGNIDIIAAQLSLTKDRVKHIEFSYPAISARYQIYFQALGYRLEWQAIFKPLSLSTWLALFAWTIIGSFCISVTYYCCLSCGCQEESKIRFTRIESFFFILQTLCQQGYPVVPKTLSIRILFLTAYAISTIIIPSYSASLISSLTSQAPIRPFDSLNEMAKDGQYNLLVKRNSATFAQFSKASDAVYKLAYERLIREARDKIAFEDTVRVLDDYICTEKQYALYAIDLVTKLKMEHRRPRCSILTLSKPLNPVFVAFGLKMNSPYSRIIDYKLLKLKNMGVVSRIKNNYRPLHRDAPEQVEFRQVEVDEIFQVFLLLLTGMVLAVVILAVELIVDKSVRYKNQQLKRKSRSYLTFFPIFIN